MMYLGDFEEGQDFNFGFSTYDADGESVTITSSDGIRIFRDDSTSGDTDPGTLSVDAYFTGAHNVFVDGGDNYLEDGSDYIVVLENAVIAAKTVNLVIAHFSIENRWPSNDTILANTNVIKNILEGDEAIDTTVTPWAVVITNKISDAELVRKSLKDTAGANITSTATVIGQKVEPA